MYAFSDREIEIGIDEAGRGPVLGPLVYGCCWWPVGCGPAMRERFGFIDSKQTTEEQRDEMFEQIKSSDLKELGFAFEATDPEQMSNLMLHHNGGQNLNQLSYDASAKLVR